ncbi:hypothetical protein HZY97_12370 [Sphingomonas sp. R-74633]|uniref:hypothetical protein n=1 Tax=Sphingomonas sp. R-74633 TaxID=2751188 RepID=UPI0015D1020D|nr:hypothetical protein [Sphingomonas sp. R-74633]NYT41558.1 hypothetical protein [Sphingomonas sp. R-74633]
MRKTAWGLAVATMAIASPALAQGITLEKGEEAMLAIDDGGTADAARGPATPTPFEVAVGRQLSGIAPPKAPVTEGVPMQNGTGLPDAPVPEAGQLRFRFLPVPGTDHSLLIIHNGYGQALRYRASITRAGKAQPTDVCLVIPGKVGVEFWPFAITAIEVSAFRLVPWKPADGAPCE